MALAMIKQYRGIGITSPKQRQGAVYIGVIRPNDMTCWNLDELVITRQTAGYSIALNSEGRPACYEDPILTPAHCISMQKYNDTQVHILLSLTLFVYNVGRERYNY